MVSAETTPKTTLPKHTRLAVLLQLERMVRTAHTRHELQFLIVNETRRLITYRRAVLLIPPTPSSPQYEVRAVSNVPVVDRAVPLLQWIERLVHGLKKVQSDQEIRHLTELDCPAELRSNWHEYTDGYGLWCPLKHPDGKILGGLWLTGSQPLPAYEVTVMQRLGEAYAFAWRAVGLSESPTRRWKVRTTTTWLLAAMITGALTIPVPMSTVAPAKIVAKDPVIVSAPIDGVISEIVVPPNSAVAKGDILFRYEDTAFRSDYRIAERNLDVAMAQYRRAAQGSFVEADHKADVPLLKAEVELRETERNYAYERLARVEVKAEQAGLILYTDKSDWIGRPVVVGQRIMELANPHRLEVRIDLPVSDAIVLLDGAQVALFLDATPFASVPAVLSHASYHAEVLPNHTLAYHVTAQLGRESSEFRIGWQGSAKIYGQQVTLFTYLFRRPISVIRPWIGL